MSERTSERSGRRERSEQSGASERVNGRASDPVLQSVFLAVPDHNAAGQRLFTYLHAVRGDEGDGPREQ